MYRLGVVQERGGAQVVVERAGYLLPIDVVLSGAVQKKLGAQPQDLMPLLRDWAYWNEQLDRYVNNNQSAFASSGRVVDGTQFLAPIALPGKIVCIGSNYHDHIAEMAIAMMPTYPYSFMKPANNTVRGSGQSVAVPRRSRMMDWEAELAVVIGAKCVNVDAATALEYVAGYANLNDLSARDWLASRPPVGVDWVQHKAFDGFAPLGPYLVPAQFIDDPQNLPVRLTVNGVTKQESNTNQMIFGVRSVVEHLTSIMTLYPGDIISTGTPAGVGHGRKPPEYLKAGDEVRMEVGPLGELVTHIIQAG
jgi:2-keto-4-pentenoate hydratase/2-oxohepta-3-ene-1,7-dioic acid hydratase in catechol pathway